MFGSWSCYFPDILYNIWELPLALDVPAPLHFYATQFLKTSLTQLAILWWPRNHYPKGFPFLLLEPCIPISLYYFSSLSNCRFLTTILIFMSWGTVVETASSTDKILTFLLFIYINLVNRSRIWFPHYVPSIWPQMNGMRLSWQWSHVVSVGIFIEVHLFFSPYCQGNSILADSGTEQLELIALSQRTGDPKYQQKVSFD